MSDLNLPDFGQRLMPATSATTTHAQHRYIPINAHNNVLPNALYHDTNTNTSQTPKSPASAT
jgi:hypothetical protein